MSENEWKLFSLSNYFLVRWMTCQYCLMNKHYPTTTKCYRAITARGSLHRRDITDNRQTRWHGNAVCIPSCNCTAYKLPSLLCWLSPVLRRCSKTAIKSKLKHRIHIWMLTSNFIYLGLKCRSIFNKTLLNLSWGTFFKIIGSMEFMEPKETSGM